MANEQNHHPKQQTCRDRLVDKFVNLAMVSNTRKGDNKLCRELIEILQISTS